jgi:hypothetical protein
VLILALISFLAAGDKLQAAPLEQTADGKALLGREGQTFRIVAHNIDVAMKAPAHWRVALSTEEPIDSQVVCESPDKKSFLEVSIRMPTGVRENAKTAPNDYLAQLRRYKDPEIEMKEDRSVVLPDGRRVSVWRFASRYFGVHLYTRITEGSAVIDVEASDRRRVGELTALRRNLAELLASYKKRDHR